MAPAIKLLYSTSTLLFCSAFILVVWVIYRLVIYPRFLSPLRHLPGPPLGGPILGTIPAMLRAKPGELQKQWVNDYGPVIRAVGPVGVERMIFIKPDALHKILVSGWLDYPRPDFMRDILGIVAGYGLLTVTGSEHKQMRKVMNPAFSIQNLTAQTDMYYDPILGLVEILRSKAKNQPEGNVEHIYEWMSKVTLDIICESAFGYKTDSLHNPQNELAEAYENLIALQSADFIMRLVILMVIPGVPKLLTTNWAYEHRHWFAKSSLTSPISVLVDSMHRIRAVSREMLASKMADAATISAEDTHAKKDIMSLLVRARSAEKDQGAYKMSDEAMMNQVLTFLGAGHETTASGLTWSLWLLANSPVVQSKLREEVSPVVATNPRPDYRTLKDLQYLDCVVMECLRLFPPVPMTIRKAATDDHVDGVFVPKGTLFYIPIRVINTYTELWGPDAEEFRPERWLSLPESYNSTFSTMTFIAGPHACIGKTMAIIEMKAVLLHLIANFEFKPSYAGQVTDPTAAVTMKPKDGMPLLVTPIHAH